MIAQATLAALALLLIYAAIGDVRHYRIPNAIPLTVVALFFAYTLAPATACTSDRPSLLAALSLGALLLAAGAALFQFNIWGGGDAKFLAALGLWAGPQKAVILLFWTALAGGVVALAMLIKSRMSASRVAEPAPAHVPYGVAIAVGGIFTIQQPLVKCFG